MDKFIQTLTGCALLLAGVVCCSTTVLSGELRSYELPSEKRSFTSRGYAVNPKRSTSSAPTIYKKFKQRVAQLGHEEKMGIRKKFTQRENQALLSNESGKAQHYRNLIAIIDRSLAQ